MQLQPPTPDGGEPDGHANAAHWYRRASRATANAPRREIPPATVLDA